MAKFTLDDAEFANLIGNIIKINGAKQVFEWLEGIPDAVSPSYRVPNDPLNKQMAYRDYDLMFYYTVTQESADVQTATIQLRRPSRFGGWIGNRKAFNSVKSAIFSAYRERGVDDGLTVRQNVGSLAWGRYRGSLCGHVETKLDYEPNSSGWNERAVGPLNDFIVFQFDRDPRNLRPRIP